MGGWIPEENFLPNNLWTYQLECLTKKKQELISGDNILNFRKINHCACVWILSDVVFTDRDGVSGGGLYWLTGFAQ